MIFSPGDRWWVVSSFRLSAASSSLWDDVDVSKAGSSPASPSGFPCRWFLCHLLPNSWCPQGPFFSLSFVTFPTPATSTPPHPPGEGHLVPEPQALTGAHCCRTWCFTNILGLSADSAIFLPWSPNRETRGWSHSQSWEADSAHRSRAQSQPESVSSFPRPKPPRG